MNEQRQQIIARINQNFAQLKDDLPKCSRFFHPSNFDFESAERIGKGGFGDVYLVNHKLVNRRKLALKRFRPEHPPYVAWKELDSMAYFQHTNICCLLGAFCGDLPTLVLENCLGNTRKQLILYF